MHINCDLFNALRSSRAMSRNAACEITNARAHNDQREEHGRSADSKRSVIDVKSDRKRDALTVSMTGDSPSEYRARASGSPRLVQAPVCSEHPAVVGSRSDSPNRACG